MESFSTQPHHHDRNWLPEFAALREYFEAFVQPGQNWYPLPGADGLHAPAGEIAAVFTTHVKVAQSNI